MEEHKDTNPARYRSREELVSELIKHSASEDMANILIDKSKVLVGEFAKDFQVLTNEFLSKLRVALEEATNEISGENRSLLIGLVGFNIFHEMVCIIMTGCAEVASLGKQGLPSFVKHAAEHYEMAAIKDTVEMMKSDLMEMIMRGARQNKVQNKEDLS
jgi:hypothetical protein